MAQSFCRHGFLLRSASYEGQVTRDLHELTKYFWNRTEFFLGKKIFFLALLAFCGTIDV